MSEENKDNIEGFEDGKGEELTDVDRDLEDEEDSKGGLFSFNMSDESKLKLTRFGGWAGIVLSLLMFSLAIAFTGYLAIVGGVFLAASIGCIFYSNSLDKDINKDHLLTEKSGKMSPTLSNEKEQSKSSEKENTKQKSNNNNINNEVNTDLTSLSRTKERGE